MQKRPGLAFFLSFLLPGAGFVYLGKWKLGLLNFGIVILVGVAAAAFLSDDVFTKYIRYIAFGCSGGSAGLAQETAKRLNAKATG